MNIDTRRQLIMLLYIVVLSVAMGLEIGADFPRIKAGAGLILGVIAGLIACLFAVIVL